jgi:hypothetical protein
MRVTERQYRKMILDIIGQTPASYNLPTLTKFAAIELFMRGGNACMTYAADTIRTQLKRLNDGHPFDFDPEP